MENQNDKRAGISKTLILLCTMAGGFLGQWQTSGSRHSETKETLNEIRENVREIRNTTDSLETRVERLEHETTGIQSNLRKTDRNK